MPDSNVIDLQGSDRRPQEERDGGDDALEEERRIAVAIVDGIRGGDAGAETRLVERYSRGLRLLIMRRMADEERARDLLQETFVIALAKLRTTNLEKPERLAGYLRGISVRVVMNAMRKRQREPAPMDVNEIAALPDLGPRPFEKLTNDESAVAVRRLLNELRVPRDRELLISYFLHDQDKEEICRALKLDSRHFNRVLYRAKQRFRELLEKSGLADEIR